MATSTPAAKPKLSKGLKITLIAVLVGAALYAVLVLRPMLAGPAESAESAPTTTERSETKSDSDSEPKSTTTTKAAGSKGSGSSSGGTSGGATGGAETDVVVANRGLNLPPDLAAAPERNPMRPG